MRTYGEDREISSARATRRRVPPAADAPEGDNLLTIVGRILKWIPADVIVLFTAAITALVDEPKDAAGKWLIFGGVVMSSLFVVGGAWAERTSGQPWLTKKAKVRAAVAPVAFLIWSPTVPDSGWQELKVVPTTLAGP
jgi:hypothetical protein